ncbi:hypothetical protein VTO42DRAFT_4427 [Malbranchea cinnamomea]
MNVIWRRSPSCSRLTYDERTLYGSRRGRSSVSRSSCSGGKSLLSYYYDYLQAVKITYSLHDIVEVLLLLIRGGIRPACALWLPVVARRHIET